MSSTDKYSVVKYFDIIKEGFVEINTGQEFEKISKYKEEISWENTGLVGLWFNIVLDLYRKYLDEQIEIFRFSAQLLKSLINDGIDKSLINELTNNLYSYIKYGSDRINNTINNTTDILGQRSDRYRIRIEKTINEIINILGDDKYRDFKKIFEKITLQDFKYTQAFSQYLKDLINSVKSKQEKIRKSIETIPQLIEYIYKSAGQVRKNISQLEVNEVELIKLTKLSKLNELVKYTLWKVLAGYENLLISELCRNDVINYFGNTGKFQIKEIIDGIVDGLDITEITSIKPKYGIQANFGKVINDYLTYFGKDNAIIKEVINNENENDNSKEYREYRNIILSIIQYLVDYKIISKLLFDFNIQTKIFLPQLDTINTTNPNSNNQNNLLTISHFLDFLINNIEINTISTTKNKIISSFENISKPITINDNIDNINNGDKNDITDIIERADGQNFKVEYENIVSKSYKEFLYSILYCKGIRENDNISNQNQRIQTIIDLLKLGRNIYGVGGKSIVGLDRLFRKIGFDYYKFYEFILFNISPIVYLRILEFVENLFRGYQVYLLLVFGFNEIPAQITSEIVKEFREKLVKDKQARTKLQNIIKSGSINKLLEMPGERIMEILFIRSISKINVPNIYFYIDYKLNLNKSSNGSNGKYIYLNLLKELQENPTLYLFPIVETNFYIDYITKKMARKLIKQKLRDKTKSNFQLPYIFIKDFFLPLIFDFKFDF